MTAWLDVIGLGEDGLSGLAPATRARLEAAEIVVGSARHHALTSGVTAKRIDWPTPFRAMLDDIGAMCGQQVAVLVTGDPLWYSVGAQFAERFPAAEVTFHPQLSAFQLAACRLGWSLADLDTLTVHGRPVEQVVPFLTPNARLLLLTQDGATPAVVAALLRERGFGSSRMTVLAALGGPNEASRTGTASDWTGPDPDFHVLAVECLADDNTHGLPLTGLPDDAFEHDGQMTKREIRALTLAALAPRRGHLLWDIGSGCGSVAIEWLRAARDTEAVGVEPRAERRALAAANATRLGAPRLQQIEGTAPEALAGLPEPDAIFIGGGLSEESAAAALAALPRHGRLVANAVTLESEALLAGLQERHGGHLVRLSVQRAETVGRRRGWRAAMPVTQWSLTK